MVKRRVSNPVPIEVPTPDDVVRLRQHVMNTMGVNTTIAQQLCAGAVHCHRRSWIRWESGERGMPVGVWELALIKLSDGSPKQVDINELKQKMES